MAGRDDEMAARAERARVIGLFRYQLIREAAGPELSTRARGRLVRAVAATEHTTPAGRRVRISRDTLDRWIRAWRRGGFDALVPCPRQSTPRLPVEVIEMAVGLKRENPARTAAQVAGDPASSDVFDPFDLTTIEVRLRGVPAGPAVPHRIGRHTHPKARPETTPDTPPTPTGIDYAELINTTYQAELAHGVNYAALTRASTPPAATDTSDGELPGQLDLLLTGDPAAPDADPAADDDEQVTS